MAPTWRALEFPTSRVTKCIVCWKTKSCGAVMVVRRGRGRNTQQHPPSWCCAACWRENPLVVYNP